MPTLSTKLDADDMKKKSITFSAESFPLDGAGKMKVRDEQGNPWTLDYKVKGNKLILSGYYLPQFFACNGVQAGHTVTIEGSSFEAECRIVVN
ncbi:hypothetical protein PTKIN_Ptkin02bG0241300 [Pterospermum kingtungense]